MSKLILTRSSNKSLVLKTNIQVIQHLLKIGPKFGKKHELTNLQFIKIWPNLQKKAWSD